MKVEGTFHLKGRGDVLTLTNAVVVRYAGASLRRISDGAVWPIRGFERFVMYLNRPTLYVGERVGLLMPADCTIAPGDEVAIVEEPCER